MKNLLPLIILTISTNSWAQHSPDVKTSEFSFKGIETEVSENQKLELLQKMMVNEYFDVGVRSTESYGFDNYHVVDFNGDELLDIIYDGREPPGLESNNLAFFLNKGDSLKLVIKFNGDFARVDIEDGKLQGFQLIYSPCCMDFVYRVEEYKLNTSPNCFTPYRSDDKHHRATYGEWNDPEYCVSLESVEKYVLGTDFPSDMSVKSGKVVKEDWFLARLRHPNKNTFGGLKDVLKGTKCQVLGQKSLSDSTYYFVKVPISEDKKKGYEKGVDVYHYGWMYKGYLE